MKSLNSVEEQVAAISAMTPPELSAWINSQLSGRDFLLENDDDVPVYYPIVAIARHLSAAVTEAIHRAILNLIREWINDPTAIDGENVLLLAQGLRVVAARAALDDLARREQFRQLSPELQYRVLQTLISLDAIVEPNFWYRAFSAAPDRLAGIAFDGLALVSPNHAVDFLSSVPNTPSAIEQIAIGLPGFMDDIVPARDRAGIRTIIESRLQEMKPLLAQAISDFFAAEQTPLAVLPLVETAPAKKAKHRFAISSDSFPALSSIGATLERVLGIGPANPAEMFANLAHQ